MTTAGSIPRGTDSFRPLPARRFGETVLVGSWQRDCYPALLCQHFAALEDRGPDEAALAYGRALWRSGTEKLADQDRLERTRFTVALSTGRGIAEFRRITKRATLVSDTLLLSPHDTGRFHRLGMLRETWLPQHKSYGVTERRRSYSDQFSDLMEPLLTAGLAWYLPRYASGFRPKPSRPHPFSTRRLGKADKISNILRYPGPDFLIHDNQAVDMSGTAPEKSKFVRPVLRIELPFVDAVDLKTFGKITIHEFGSYQGFRYFLRDRFLELDDAMHADQPDSEIARLGQEIKEEIRMMDAKMRAVRRQRAVAVTGAVVGSVQAVLVAVYGPVWAAATVAALGAAGGGGVWGVINAAAQHRKLRDEEPWYYVWALSRKSTVT
jgi:hypothetical protein